jgi:hypothetical protein
MESMEGTENKEGVAGMALESTSIKEKIKRSNRVLAGMRIQLIPRTTRRGPDE